MQIYLARNNVQAGPYTLEQLNQMLASGQVALDDLIWHKGMSEWRTVGDVTQGQAFYQPALPDTSAAQPNPAVSLTKTPETSAPATSTAIRRPVTGQVQPATLGQRFAAKLIDLSLWIPLMLIPPAMMTVDQQQRLMQLQSQVIDAMSRDQLDQAQAFSLMQLQLIPDAVWLAMGMYLLIMLAGQAIMVKRKAATLGKSVMGLSMLDRQTQQPVGVMRGFVVRSVVFILMNLLTNGLISLIDHALLFGPRRLALHDRLARTEVVTRR